MAVRSLRARLILGTALFAAGIIASTSVMTTALHYRPTFMMTLHGLLLTLSVTLCVLAGVAQVRYALRPLEGLSKRLLAVRAGREKRLLGEYPSEVQPLVAELNLLLEHHERMVARARAQADDLAHGLKTPLAVLALEAEQLATSSPEVAATLDRQIARMRLQVEYRLAQVRAGSGSPRGTAPVSIADSVDRLLRTLRRLYEKRHLTALAEVSPSHQFRGSAHDLEEMLGNLLDNAFKWANSTIEIRSQSDGAELVVTVDDDGPGLSDEASRAVLERGTRVDEAVPGSGLGLAIVRDYASLYGGSIALARSPKNGVRATLRLPTSEAPSFEKKGLGS